MKHIPVLCNEVIEMLNIKSNGIYLDLTLGYAGHASAILKKIKDKGFLIAFDLDQKAIKYSDKLLSKISKRYEIIHSNYKYLAEELKKRNIEKVDGILIDLGVSSPQLDEENRGFSYKINAPLDMRMDLNNNLTAKYIVNNYALNDLIRILRNNAEEKDAYRIAKNIVNYRKNNEIKSTFDLVDIIKKSKSNYVLSKKGHPAKQTFQALRIEVNDELNNLKETLGQALNFLKEDGRLIVISFHSLEDRIVKKIFNSKTKVFGNRDDYVLPNSENLEYELINKKVIIPSAQEILFNHRSKSAKLRAIRKK